jgi:nucleosome binding factor SPN SPT16 subunit
VASITVHHKLCCSTVARTLMFNAKKDQIEIYNHLFQVFEECMKEIKPGASMRKIYEKASSSLKDRDSKLVGNLFPELGWALGYEVRDRRYLFNEESKATFQAGMLVCLRLGLENLTTSSKDEQSKKYSLLIADTFVVTTDGAECLTESVQRRPKKVQWNLDGGDDEKDAKTDKKTSTKEEVDRKLKEEEHRRKMDKMSDAEKKAEREQWEKRNSEMAEARVEEQKRRRNQGGDATVEVQKKVVTDYTGTDDYPSKAFGHGKCYTQLCVDAERGQETITNLQLVHKSISDMRKSYTQLEKERQATAEVEEQPALRVNPNRGPRLQNVRVYPNLQARGRKTEGDLEAHLNGFRFTAKKDKNNASVPASSRVIDIIYKNIKHAFYQPSNRFSSLIILHFRLKSPIMINKAAAKDVQFYIEIEDNESLLDNRRRNQFDKDEIEDEERHKKVLAKLDKEFKSFCDRTYQQLPPKSKADPDGDKIWEWDIPYTELMFQGTPKNQMVELFPTVNCIVNLASKPVFITDMDEIDMAYYERMNPEEEEEEEEEEESDRGNFDLALVYKKFVNQNPPPKLAECWERITAIDMKYLDSIREVLQKSSIPQYEGTTTVNWQHVLRDYVKNFDDITADGGWKVVFGDDDDEGEVGESV